MTRRSLVYITVSVLAFVLAGVNACSTLNSVSNAGQTSVSPTVIAQARTTVLGVENLYGIAVITADNWAKLPKCGAPAAGPICPTNSGIIAINKAAIATRTGLLQAETLVLKADPTQSELTIAITTAQTAWSTYQTVLAQYGIQTRSN